MLRILTAILTCSLLVFSQSTQAEVRFQAQVDHIRFNAVDIVILFNPETIFLKNDCKIIDESGALIALVDLKTRQLDTGQKHWIRVALEPDGTARRVEVLGVAPLFPDGLGEDEITVLISDINTDNNSILPDTFPFVEIAPLSLDSPGTSIFDADQRRISLKELQTGSVVRVSGHFEGIAFKADRIDVLHEIIHTGFGGIVVDIRTSGGQTELVFNADHAEWLDQDVEIHFGDDFVGTGIDAVRAVLSETSGPLSVQLTDYSDHNGKFRRARFFQGATLGKQWENNHEITMQVRLGAEGIGESQDDGKGEDGFPLKPAMTVFAIPGQVNIWDQVDSESGQTEEGSIADLEPFVDVWVNIQLSGERVVSADISINQRPVFKTFDLVVGWRDRGNNRIGFDMGGSIHLLPTARILDVSGNALPGLHRFWDLQHEQQSVALVTIDPTTGRGSEARLVPFEELGTVGDDQIVIGAVIGIYRGFWSNPEEGEIGTHSLEGILLDTTELTDLTGQHVSEALLERGVGATVTGALVSDRIFIQRIELQGEATSWSFSTRVQDIHPQGNFIQFEESDPVRVDRDAEVFDHFGGPASLQFIQELFQRGDLQLRLTFGESSDDGSRVVTRVEAFRHNDTVDEGVGQEIVTSGRLDPWSNPPLLYPQEIRDVTFGPETEIIGLDGSLLGPNDIDKGVRVLVSGLSIVRIDPNQFSSRTHNAVTRIEILGGAATQYQGFVADVSGSTILFKTPDPLFVSPHTDFQEETGFRIDFFTLASRLVSEGGLRMWLSGEFGVPGEGEVWWGRIMRPDEPTPKFLSDDQTIAFVVGADPDSRSLFRAPIPEVNITDKTEIRSRTGQTIAQADIIPDALITVVTEDRGGSPVAIEIVVDRIPQPFQITAAVDYVDAERRFIEFQTPDFLSLTSNAEIIDANGSLVDLAGLQAHLIDLPADDRLLRVTVTPDSPTDAPIVSRIEVIGTTADESESANSFTIFIDEPEYRVRVFDRRIEPTPLPKARITPDAEIVSIDGSPIDIHDIQSGMRVRVGGQDSDGRLSITEIRIVGGFVFVAEGVIARIDIPNRLLYPEPDPPKSIDPRAFIAGIDGSQVSLEDFTRVISENDDLIVVVELSPFENTIFGLGLLNPEFGRPHRDNIELWDAYEVEINLAARMLEFRDEGPARLADDVTILGPQGEPLMIEDLQPGFRAFVRGEAIGDDIIITAITVIPEIYTSDLAIQIGDFDEDGTENDVIINLLDQDGNAIALPLKVFMDFRSPFEARSGHIMTDVPAGPHVVRVEVASRPEIHDEARVFISVHGSTLSILETFPADGAIGIATNSDIRITFNEPIQQFGDFVSVKAEILPKPLSNDEDMDISLEEDGKIFVLTNVKLDENTSYTINISSASSRNGSTLTDPVQVRFSTGSTLLELGSLAGSVTLETAVRFIGTVHLFDEDGQRVQEARITESGSFTFNAVFEGSYTLVAEAMTEDGRTVSGVLDGTVALGAGEIRAGLDISITFPADSDLTTGSGNSGATVVLDLDSRSGNQGLHSLLSLPDTEIRVAVYALDVQDVIAYNVSFNYDSTAVRFTGVDEGTDSEVNLLKQLGGLAVTLPPTVSANSIDYAGAILGRDPNQAVTGDGLLAVFKFKTKADFSDPAEFLIPRVLIQSRTSRDTLSTLARASVELASHRILLGLSATPDTIVADGLTAARLIVDLKDADGNPVSEETAVRFEIVDGSAQLSQTEMVTGSSQAAVDLTGNVAGIVTVQVSVDGATAERISVYLEASTPVGIGPIGQIALDLDTTSGDQQSRVNQSLAAGDDIVVDIVIVDEVAAGMSGFELVLLFDSDVLAFNSFTAMDIFDRAAAIVTTGRDTVTVSCVLLGAVTNDPSGTIGQATFQIQEGAAEDATVTILRAQLGGPDGQLPLMLGTGGATVLLGVGTGEATPDFDGDGVVGFTDFIAFAEVFGSSSETEKYDARFDLDASGDVGFSDFLIFAQAFGASAKRSTKPTTSIPRILDLESMVENLGEGRSRVTFAIAEGQGAQAYGLSLGFDPENIEIVSYSSQFESDFSQENEPALSNLNGVGVISFADFGSTDESRGLVTVTFKSQIPAGSINVSDINVVDLSGQVSRLQNRSVAFASLPDRVSLGQNFPNPFNPETVIPFALPESGAARVSIYNLVGQEIAVLVDDHMDAGRHTVRWNGRDDLGRAASTGIYFVRMIAGSDLAVSKIVLMK